MATLTTDKEKAAFARFLPMVRAAFPDLTPEEQERIALEMVLFLT
jgi:hypothetical protein